MNKATKFAICLCMLAKSARPQQIAQVDLTRPPVPIKSVNQTKPVMPQECDKALPQAMADGFVEPPDHERREIIVEIVKANNQPLVIGSEAQYKVQLRNSGKFPIQIPWGIEPSSIEKYLDPYHSTWEVGEFSIVWQGDFTLLNLMHPLYGSKLVAGSMLTIQPNEWVTAEVKFKFQPEYPITGRTIKDGDGGLLARWEQTETTRNFRDAKNCSYGLTFLRYSHYYLQQNPAISISATSKNSIVR